MNTTPRNCSASNSSFRASGRRSFDGQTPNRERESMTAIKKRLRIGVVFGGRSGEHEVSLASAASVIRALDPEKYEAVPIGISKDGRWLVGSPAQKMLPEILRAGQHV